MTFYFKRIGGKINFFAQAYTHGIEESAGRYSAGHSRKSSAHITPVERSLTEDLDW